MHWADYLIFVLYVLTTLGIGMYHGYKGRKNKSPEQFIMANRKLKVIPAALSLVVTELSAVGILSATAEMYTRGSMLFIWGSISHIIIAVVVSRVVIPWLYPLKLMSINSYLLMRFRNLIMVRVTSVVVIFATISWSAVALYAPSLALQTATGLSVYISVPVVSVVCIIFTTLGGMKAVVWTDVFQSTVMLGGCLAILIKACLAAGGFAEMFSVLNTEGRFITDISPDPTVRHTVWGFLVGHTVMYIHWLGLGQNPIQRFSSVSSLEKAMWLPLLFSIGYILLEGLGHLTGVALLAYYANKQCDPIASGQISNPNELLPLFVKEMFSNIPGFSGLFLASIYSSTISTVSTNLSGNSANALMDFVKPRFPRLSDEKAAMVSQVFVVVFGLITLGAAFFVGEVEGPFVQIVMSMTSLLSGPIFGFFIIGGLKVFKNIQLKGILVGYAVSFSLMLWIFLGSMTVEGQHPPLPPVSVEGCDSPVNATMSQYTPITGLKKFYTLSYLWNTLLSTFVTIVVGIIFSYIFDFIGKPEEKQDIPENLFIQITGCCSLKDGTMKTKDTTDDLAEPAEVTLI